MVQTHEEVGTTEVSGLMTGHRGVIAEPESFCNHGYHPRRDLVADQMCGPEVETFGQRGERIGVALPIEVDDEIARPIRKNSHVRVSPRRRDRCSRPAVR